ncbi:MAG: ABC transporter permease [Lactobacillus sp.]|uniref:ABC transporter permease n=1 Tax=Lactobacillus sp. TaxID=1591 RepID=UPI0023C28FAB|nr:ABC transporter permease [Lactobacillus sp.]MDE7050675.1 ABC transporter permease [Lactobacillus sp.]
MNKTWLVAKETYRREVKNWSFLLMIFAPFLVLVISFFFGMSSSSAFDTNTKVGIVSQNQNLTQSLKKTEDFDVYKSKAKVEKAYQAGDINGYVVVDNNAKKFTVTYYGTEKLDNDAKTELMRNLNVYQQALNLKNAKLSQKQLRSLSQKVKFTEKTSSKKLGASDEKNLKTATFWILIFVLYFLVQTYSTIMAQDIASEKGTKIMEMIFSSMPGGSYFDGKVLGIFMEILTQLLIYALMFSGFYYLAPHIDGVKETFTQIKPAVDQVLGQIISWGLVFVILGLILYIVYAAVCGAIVTKAEDANKAVQPLVYLTLLGLFSSMSLSNNPDGIFAMIMSYVPFLSSFLMPLRLIKGNASSLEAIISMIILAVFLLGSIWWIRKIYPSLILQTDDNGMWKNMKRALQGIKE